MKFSIHVLNLIRCTSETHGGGEKLQIFHPQPHGNNWLKKKTRVSAAEVVWKILLKLRNRTQLPVRNRRDWQETVSQWWLSDLSHMNSPRLARAELSSAVFTLPLSLSSALRVISSAVCSIASPMKNAPRVTNLLTWSQKDVCVEQRGGLESALLLQGAASRPGCCLSGQSWEHPGQMIL